MGGVGRGEKIETETERAVLKHILYKQKTG